MPRIYQEQTPSKELAPYIKCFWTMQSDSTNQIERVFPGGCVEILFHLGEKYKSCAIDSNDLQYHPRNYVFGQTTKPHKIQQTGIAKVFGVRFHPWGAFPFFNHDVYRLSNKRSDLSTMFNGKSRGMLDLIRTSSTFSQRIDILQSHLLKLITKKNRDIELYKRLVKEIINLKGNILSTELAEMFDMNKRKLERDFKARIGINPNKFIQIVRFQNFLYEKLKNDNRNLTQLAYDCFYSDQSHLSREFKRFSGLTPKYYFQNKDYVTKTNRYLSMRMF